MSSDASSPILNELKERFSDKLTEVRASRSIVKISTTPEQFKFVASFLKERGFDHVKGVTGCDLIALKPSEDAIEVIYHVGSYSVNELKGTVVSLATKVPRSDPRLASLVDVWPSAEYHERETYEMLGVTFEGHPRLKRLLLPEWWSDKPPLRKDFAPT
ncbi:MAG: NADH-quinone oxidoreductase subunit C [Aigarchaeota archaeon]|nr:NADH-quinone oxidoreductase subunit C [Aigarchaeota archaeon]MDW8092443.1 NADH-quinone oxidoreductase subunit C [Nitrososphaerota archaeon]